MNPESIPEALSLKEAVTYWTPPNLAHAVFLAEATFPEEERDRQQREWIFEIIRRRQHRDPPPVEAPSPDVQRLRQAWQEMFEHFSTGVAYGEIALWGRLAKPLARAHQERLSFKRAKHLLYHPRANTILDENATYWDVVATRSGATANWENRARDLRIAAGDVPLATALREWADPTLISQVCHLERQYTEHQLAGLTTLMMLSDLEDLTQPTNGSRMGDLTDPTQLLSAREKLEDDFRARLIGGEFHLKGVMAKPRRELQPEILPGVWAADFVFDCQRDAVSFDDTRYVAVTASYGDGAAGKPIAEPPSDGSPGVASGEAISDAAALPAQRMGGRKNTKPIVDEALRALWGDLFPTGAPDDPRPWTGLALRLIKHVEKSGHGRRIGFPKEETVRKHLPEIYGRLLVEKGEIAPNDQ